ncbi:MAG: class I SAM-dependent methyltransferase [Phycisphaerales bacterium]|nr:MAG: class I SAM-dependent methyltransferase [Phycisphaerales bacterium]
MKVRDVLIRRFVVDRFIKLYYHSRPRIWNNTFWFGVPIGKCPPDLWTYQEIIFETKPDVIIECGTGSGGSALFLAQHCDLMHNDRIITIDIIDQPNRPVHERITYITGSSTAERTLGLVAESIGDKDRVLVILDSDHSKHHVLEELNHYGQFVTLGSYVVVEDTIIGGHPVKPHRKPGPMEAVKEFVKGNESFIIDKSREKFYLTFNRNGYLKRVK